MKKKIAYFGIKGLPSKAGADRVVEAIASGVNKDEYDVSVYCSSQVVPEGATYPGIRLIRIPTLPGKHLHATSLFILGALHALLFGDFDLIHLHNVEASFMLPFLRLRYKVVSTSHAVPQDRDKWGTFAKFCLRVTEYPFLKLSNELTGVGAPLTAYYLKQYGKEIKYIPNGVDDHIDIDSEGALEILAKHGLEPQKYLLFAAGRIIPTKGCHYLLKAFQEIDSDIKLLIVGDEKQWPEYVANLRKMADDRVKFGSFISSKKTLMGLIENARFFVFPSTVEAMSMMLLETASVGTPIVASDIPENTGVLPEQVLFFESANVDDLREKLEYALDHPDEMHDLSAQAKNWVNYKYRWHDIVKEYEFMYAQLLPSEHQAVARIQSL